MAATPEEFTTVAVARLRQLVPPPEVRIVESLVLEVIRPGSEPATIRLQNLWWAHLSDPEQLRSRLDQLAVAVSNAAADAPLELERLVPIVRARSALPQTAPVQPLIGSLVVGLAIDGQQTRRVVRRIDADLLRMPDPRLFLTARANLGLLAGTLRRERLGPVTRLHLNGDLDSSLLVLRPLWKAVVHDSGGPVVVAAPARGALVFAPLAEAEALQQTARHLRRMAPWPLPLVWMATGGEGWRPHSVG
ncbi:MAG TPA: hypothetical protein DFR83_18610 [Deltaproteobacteria bacterium]|nr:hypothetical protein [Deltaproteobacteria bacterium]